VTPDQLELIELTSDALLSVDGRLADRFYERLFEIAPDTRLLFGRDLEEQKIKLLNMLASLVGAVRNRELFASILSHLGRRHAGYGVVVAHYSATGTALMASLAEILGPRFTEPVSEAWKALYDDVEREMLHGAEARRVSEDRSQDVMADIRPVPSPSRSVDETHRYSGN
jgi:nitric oxide dioxygenase